jgi:hypothetical protein
MPVGVSAYVALANVTLGSGASSITFSSIGQGFRDLVVIFNGSLPSGQSLFMRLNADSSNHSLMRIYNDGGGTPSAGTLSNWEIGFNNTTLFSKTEIMDYATTNKHKTSLIRWGNADGTSYTMAAAGRWASTSAVTSIALVTSGGGNITAGSTFSLFGVSA